MANLMPAPRYVAVDGDGNVMPGALLNFYVTGTSTPKDVYTDAGGTPFTQPVEADPNGLFPAIYLGQGDYKVILQTAAAVTVWTTDPVSGTTAVDTLTTRGDLLTRDASGYARLPIGTAGLVLTSNGVEPVWSTAPPLPYGLIQGLTYQNNSGDATNDIDIAVGVAMDSTNARFITLGAALTKKLDAAWAVGTNQGGLDTGSIADTDYYIYLIHRSDTSVTDILFSTSATAPTMPTNYNYKRLIGWFRRASAAIVAFKTYEREGGGLEFKWSAPTTDVALGNTLTTTRRTDVIKVPVDFSVTAIVRIFLSDASAGFAATICCPDETDAAPSSSASPGVNFFSGATTDGPTAELYVRTDATGAIAARSNLATTDVYRAWTVGFIWGRRL